ncbi:TetR/AcrR family transcriptional regulator [Arthrobacter sulfonylureivorans]|uniref:TetR/AcrR family transcriptional regulator n=1 Tax=Arthrobacter sulfonylureivorans TaxID=2486855 RepID=A0ABY3W9N0_9MICC|nr:TetR/AcrR family transcriptional regulator [Arthrobacter sulfonylureivorans]UNK45016.1 TetR/AcrR family transcriptional regulator [Arthrobacter sulfonylureivorans]
MRDDANNDGGGLRERKRAATRSAITASARLLTARSGINGFTVEEVCERAGISRRTFFNYFPAKEDAILGHPGDDIPEALAEAFVAGGRGTAAGAVSASLWPDFIELAVGMMESMAMTRSEVVALKEAITAEPRLMEKAMHGSSAAEQHYVAMLAERESLPADDPRLQMAIGAMASVAKYAGTLFFAPDNTRSYRDILTSAIEALAAVAPLPGSTAAGDQATGPPSA